MANSRSARKRARQAVRRRSRNASARSNLRTAIKKVLTALDSGNAQEAQEAYTKAVPVIDAGASKGLIHANKAARHKSRLNKRLKALA